MRRRELHDRLPSFLALHRILLIAFLLSTSGQFPQSLPAASAGRLPARLENYLDTVVRLAPSDQKRLLEGSPVTKFLDADPNQEVAVFGAVWINAPQHLYVQSVKDIESLERGGAFKATKRISNPPKLADFAPLHLPAKDIADLKSCRVGDCQLKLSRKAIERIRAEVDWTKPTANAAVEDLFRQLLYRYATGYLESGNARLAVYRDNDRPTFVETEFESLVGRMPSLANYLPELQRYLLDYPKATLPNSTDFLYWQEARFGLKPTIRVSHLVVRERAEETVVASKMLYSSHYFWTALELRVLVADPSRGPGFWFVTVNRSRSDGLDGFLGRVIRSRVHREVQKGALAALKATKTKLERQVR